MFEIFVKEKCVYCLLTKKTLEQAGFDYVVNSSREVLTGRLGDFQTYPQIFKDGEHIGGFVELAKYLRQHE